MRSAGPLSGDFSQPWPTAVGVECDELGQGDDHPEDELKRNVGGFVAENPLREKGARPTPCEFQKMEPDFANAPRPGYGPSLIDAVEQKRDE